LIDQLNFWFNSPLESENSDWSLNFLDCILLEMAAVNEEIDSNAIYVGNLSEPSHLLYIHP